VYALLNKSRAFDQLVLHPRVLPVLDALLIKNHLITAFQAIKLLPGETPQPFHYDDQFVPFARPRPFTSVATIWALDEFTETNGATNVIPGSHLCPESRKPTEAECIPVVMPAGSVVMFLSTLWHRGGRNTSSGPRLAISSQHCQPFIRPQENQLLAVDEHLTASLHPRLQRMMGLSIHPPFIGHANGVHPAKALESRLAKL
jgi:ectoine hydroxylase-related dioxygenase (phytanoyl-CoA dioxygenase family)